jgi:hypothetical protein
MKVRSFALAAALLAVGQARGQLAVGDVLPPQALEDFAQIGATSSADLVGRAVLYEFFAFW